MAGMRPDEPVRIEQFAVGVHGLRPGTVHRLFPTELRGVHRREAVPRAGTGPFGPAIVPSRADVKAIAQDTPRPGRAGRPRVRQPTIGTDITFRFANAAVARRALRALATKGSITPSPAGGAAVDVVIDDPAAIRQITTTARRETRPTTAGRVPTTGITFAAGGQRFRAQVLSGPGGDFLSNEVSFRVLRATAARTAPPVSFHVHTPRDIEIPQDRSTRAARVRRRKALAGSRTLLRTLIETLRRIVRAVGRRILAARRSTGGGSPP